MKAIIEITQDIESLKEEKKEILKKAGNSVVDLIRLRSESGRLNTEDLQKEIDTLLEGFSSEELVEIFTNAMIEIYRLQEKKKASKADKKKAKNMFGERMRDY